MTVCDYGSCCDFLDGCGSWMDGVTCSVDLSMEARVLVSGVVYGAGGAICFKQLVVSFDFIPNTFFGLFLDVVSVFIPYTILKFILSWSLKKIVTLLRKDYGFLCTSHESTR